MNYVSANEAFNVVLERIAGPSGGFYSDVDGRVYESYVDPSPDDLTPYLCAPAIREDGQYDQGEDSTASNPSWLRRVWGFVLERSQDPRKPSAPRDIRRLKWDIERAFEGPVGDELREAGVLVEPIAWDVDAGYPLEGTQYGKVEVVFRVSLWTGHDVAREE